MEKKMILEVFGLTSEFKKIRTLSRFLMALVGLLLLSINLSAQLTTLSVGGTNRSMFVYAPSNLGQNRPLVISMHGLNQDINYQKGQAKWEQVADTAKFVVVYPAGINNSWDISGNRDTDFITAIINNMVTRFGIDRNRVYVSGFSMGGMMSYHTANKIADKVAAIGPVSGYLFANPVSSSRPMPIIHVHGTADDVVRYPGLAAILQKWRTWNKCPSTGVTTDPYPANRPNSPGSRQYWGPCDKSAVELISIEGKGHWHSNDVDVHTTKELWRFFKGYSLSTTPAGPSIALTSPTPTSAFTAPATISLAATASVSSGSISDVRFYNGTTLLNTDNAAPYAFSWTNVAAGTYTVRAVVTDNTSKTAEATVTFKVNPAQEPYNGTAHVIPGIIQMEHFDVGGNGFAYMDNSPGSAVTPVVNFRTNEDVDLEACTDAGGGYNLGFAMAGEWLEYSVNVENAGPYDLDLRVACNGTGRTVSLSVEGTPIGGPISIPTTGDWQSWTTTTVKGLQLKAGPQVLRFTIGATDYVNINYMSFKPSMSTSTTFSDAMAAGMQLYPNPFETSFHIAYSKDFSYKVFDITGHLIQQGNGSGEVSIGESLKSGVYLLQISDRDKSYTVKIYKK